MVKEIFVSFKEVLFMSDGSLGIPLYCWILFGLVLLFVSRFVLALILPEEILEVVFWEMQVIMLVVVIFSITVTAIMY